MGYKDFLNGLIALVIVNCLNSMDVFILYVSKEFERMWLLGICCRLLDLFVSNSKLTLALLLDTGYCVLLSSVSVWLIKCSCW